MHADRCVFLCFDLVVHSGPILVDLVYLMILEFWKSQRRDPQAFAGQPRFVAASPGHLHELDARTMGRVPSLRVRTTSTLNLRGPEPTGRDQATTLAEPFLNFDKLLVEILLASTCSAWGGWLAMWSLLLFND